MAVSATDAVPAIPYQSDIRFATARPTGTINPGDWLAYSGQFVIPTFSGDTGYWKSSGAGMAMDANPIYDQAGRVIVNTALQILVEGVVIVTAAFSGQPTLGLGAYPVSSGSGVAAPTGQTGVGATWQTAQVRSNSALSGTANGQQPAVATVIGSRNFVNGGTGELAVRLQALAPDVRG